MMKKCWAYTLNALISYPLAIIQMISLMLFPSFSLLWRPNKGCVGLGVVSVRLVTLPCHCGLDLNCKINGLTLNLSVKNPQVGPAG